MNESIITITGRTEIVKAYYYQNPNNKSQNVWCLKVKNNNTFAILYLPTERSQSNTKVWRESLSEGNTITFEATLIKDKVVIQEVTVIDRKPFQTRLVLTDLDKTIEKLKAS